MPQPGLVASRHELIGQGQVCGLDYYPVYWTDTDRHSDTEYKMDNTNCKDGSITHSAVLPTARTQIAAGSASGMGTAPTSAPRAILKSAVPRLRATVGSLKPPAAPLEARSEWIGRRPRSRRPLCTPTATEEVTTGRIGDPSTRNLFAPTAIPLWSRRGMVPAVSFAAPTRGSCTAAGSRPMLSSGLAATGRRRRPTAAAIAIVRAHTERSGLQWKTSRRDVGAGPRRTVAYPSTRPRR